MLVDFFSVSITITALVVQKHMAPERGHVVFVDSVYVGFI